MIETKTYSVAAIENGTVIDHIDVGYALQIVKLLKLAEHQSQVTLALNLPSKKNLIKDLIKVESRYLSTEETSQIAILAPSATINIIENYQVKEKYQVTLPDKIEGIIHCPNPHCITNHEKAKSVILVLQRKKRAILQCNYCRSKFEYVND